jgi:hypothetical protein
VPGDCIGARVVGQVAEVDTVVIATATKWQGLETDLEKVQVEAELQALLRVFVFSVWVQHLHHRRLNRGAKERMRR